MGTLPKTPPRFVPTLTDVVHLPPAARLPGNGTDPRSAAIVPPVIAAAGHSGAWEPVSASDVGSESEAARSLPDGIEEYVVHRIMQRVDLVLDQRLREAIAMVVQEQTRSMVPRLREEVESVVRHAVYEAVADELAGDGRAD